MSGYEVGRKLGPPLYQRGGRILRKQYFDKTGAFFEKHGNNALVIGRFVPFVRTCVTVVAAVTDTTTTPRTPPARPPTTPSDWTRPRATRAARR